MAQLQIAATRKLVQKACTDTLNEKYPRGVHPSIDPFFFHVYRHEADEKKEEHRSEQNERLNIRGFKSDRFEFDEIELGPSNPSTGEGRADSSRMAGFFTNLPARPVAE